MAFGAASTRHDATRTAFAWLLRAIPQSGMAGCETPGATRQRAKREPLFDNLVGEREHRRRNGKAEGLGGGEIEDQGVLGRLLHRNIGGLCAAENLVDIVC